MMPHLCSDTDNDMPNSKSDTIKACTLIFAKIKNLYYKIRNEFRIMEQKR